MDTKLICQKRNKLAADIQILITTFESECTAVVKRIDLHHDHPFGSPMPETDSVEIKVGIDV